MAEKDVVGSLFGMTPESYQQALARRTSGDNLAAAQLTPGQLAGYYAMEAGSGLGRAAQGLLGVEDPQLNLIRQTNQLVQQIGVDTPEKLKTLAGELQKLPGGAPLAAQAVAQANKMLESAATVTAKNREQISGLGKLVRERDALADANPNDPRIKEYNKAIAAEGEGKSTKIVLPGEAQNKQLGEANIKRYVDLGDAAQTSSKTLDLVNTFNKVIDTSFTGLGADAVLTAAQFANAVGANVKGTTESEIIDNILAQMTLGQASKLKGALSDKDLLFLKKTVGERGLTTDTLKYVMNEIGKDAEITKGVYKKATEYRRTKGNDFADFDFVGTADEIRSEIKDRYKNKESEAEYKKGYNQYVAKQQKLKKQPQSYEQWLPAAKKQRGE